MRRAHLPARDLRLLDPLLSYPSSILGREHAIVVNLEHIKMIITAQEVFLLDAQNPIVAPFVQNLRRRLPASNSTTQNVPPDRCNHAGSGCEDHTNDRERREGRHCTNTPTEQALPFEFQALEVCLEAACQRLDSEAGDLSKAAHHALDALTSRVSIKHLENVRQVKNKLVLITGRAQRVRAEIEQLLDDDGDMTEMYLSTKLVKQQLEVSMRSDTTEQTPAIQSADSGVHGRNHGVVHSTSEGSCLMVTVEDPIKYVHDSNLRDLVPTRSSSRTKRHAAKDHSSSSRSSLAIPCIVLLNSRQPTSHTGKYHNLQSCVTRMLRNSRKLPKTYWLRCSEPDPQIVNRVCREEEHPKQRNSPRNQSPLRRSNLHHNMASSAKQFREHLKLGHVSFDAEQVHNNTSLLSSTSSMSRTMGSAIHSKRQHVEELEMLLEAYFVLIDGIIRRVALVQEYIDDTEDFVKITLADHQNTLLKVNIVLIISCLGISMFIAVTGIFGMNIDIPLFNVPSYGYFWSVVGMSSGATVILSATIIGWCKYTDLI
nr:magnesium transporter MRS2-F-like isoform X4 [Physcomitrium patens]|eukprot:XP_024372445.1 magnesium transporter MRS2-F-like isoform X4 [Physcomitrella patens]